MEVILQSVLHSFIDSDSHSEPTDMAKCQFLTKTHDLSRQQILSPPRKWHLPHTSEWSCCWCVKEEQTNQKRCLTPMNYLNIVLIPQACQRSHENSTSWKINRLEAGVFVHTYLWCVFVHARAGNIQDSTYSMSAMQASVSISSGSKQFPCLYCVDHYQKDFIFYPRNK